MQTTGLGLTVNNYKNKYCIFKELYHTTLKEQL